MLPLLPLTELPEPELAAPVDLLALGERTDAELDLLPYGIVGLSLDGTIEQYNLAESRLARLDRNQVLGRSFFHEVAPCTATAQFEGCFREFTRPGATARTVSFDYIFDFKFGAQQVSVEMVRAANGRRVHLVINRTRFLAPRPQVPLEIKAPLQLELAPAEPRQGVLRDRAARRAVYTPPLFFASLMGTWERMAPQAWGPFCGEWGLRWGRLAVVDLEMETLEAHLKGLRELPIQQAVELIAGSLQRQGWGRLGVDFSASRTTGAIVLTLERNALAESVGAAASPRCHLFSGYFRALFNHLAQKLLVVRELRCSAQGRGPCTFLVLSQARKAELEAAVTGADGNLARALSALEGAARARP
ncbi:PAS domain-containing protein [Aggregicoccus sp. 17bor-14]|uniref:V4R domain-containing protein n=1 Tax=Myxococcaceae TaxID=31 RepID=UPI00129C4039|nr:MULTISPECIES: V4R domain-containing protein [Myxococcaceae]MBF5041671.1 PAS domain-containing protein [Simulacricoccus sp. 17bor-14]MRI87453.1 PAS domain-containing protein [Aggregicoccus sp. 17bor-14]